MKILLIYRQTAEGQAALAAARTEARLHGATILVVRHVKRTAEQPVPDVRSGGRPLRDADSRQDLAVLSEELDAVASGLQADGLDAQALLLTDGADAAEAILDVARTEAVDRIVIGIRRRSPVGKLVLGSLSQDVLLHADCPVLAVKADE